MAHQLFQLPRGTAISSNLTLVAGAKVEFFLTETTTPTPVYQDSDLSTEHTNPVVADAAGRLPPIYLDPLIVYKIEFRDSADVEIYPAVDPANDQFLSQAIIGAFLHPRTQPEIDVDVMPSNFAISPGDPKGSILRYGNNTVPGTTDMRAAIQAAFDVGGRVTFPPGGVVKCNSAVEIDLATTMLDGQGAALLSGLSSPGVLLTLGSSGGAEQCTRNCVRNLVIGGTDVAGVVAIEIDAASQLAGSSLEYVSFYDFETEVRLSENAFCINFNGCTFKGCSGTVFDVAAATEAAERITFNFCTFANNARVFASVRSSCQIYANFCSFDYCDNISQMDDGMCFINFPYVESNLDTNRWFITGTGENAFIKITGGTIAVVGAKTTYPLAYADTGSVIRFEGVRFFSSTDEVGGDYLGEGSPGDVYAENCSISGFTQNSLAWVGGSPSQNLCDNGDFTTDVAGWTVSHTGTASDPARDATAGSGGGPAMVFDASDVGSESRATWTINAEPGKAVGVAMAIKGENVAADFTFVLQAIGNSGAVIASSDVLNGHNNFGAASNFADTNWHTYRNVFARLPSGTTQVKLVAVSDYSSAYKVWIENVVLCKY
jgi:hypothetical protein